LASYYVYSGAAGAGTGADWANAFTTLDGAFSGKAAGDIFYVADDHAQTQASALTLTSPGTAAAPCFVYCVRRTGGSVPPVSADLRTTATVTTTGANGITFGSQAVYSYGIIFRAGTGAVTNTISGDTTATFVFEACSLRKLGTSGVASAITFAAAGCYTTLINTTLQFGNTADSIRIGGKFVWRNTASAIAGATIPASGLFQINTQAGVGLIEGVDLSALGSGTTLFRAGATPFSCLVKDCKLGSSVTVAAAPTSTAFSAQLIRGDSGDTNYRTERYDYTGTLTTETTIVRTGGASDGTTPISWKVITTANSERIYPFECFPISIWNETVGSSVTVTVECRGAAIPNLDEMWMDVEFLGTSGFPQGNFSTTGHANLLLTGTANTSSSESWGGSTSSFKLVASITPQEKGPITCYVKVAKASSTYYIDPKITLT
jgi:hypothetical protein